MVQDAGGKGEKAGPSGDAELGSGEAKRKWAAGGKEQVEREDGPESGKESLCQTILFFFYSKAISNSFQNHLNYFEF